MRIAVVGCGSAGMRHLRAFAAFPGVEAVAVPCRPARRAELCEQGVAAAASLADAGPLDGAVIATDTGRHLSDLADALARGVPFVLIEKPLAPSLCDIARFVPGTRADANRLFVGYCLRFDAGLGAFRELLPQIGATHGVDIQCRSFLPDWRPQRPYQDTYAARPDEGGVLRDLSHEIDYACWLWGVPEHLSGWLARSGRLEIASEDQAALWWNAPGGPRVSLALDYLARVPVRRMTAFGAQGTLCWDAIGHTVRLKKPGLPAKHRETRFEPDALFREQARAFLSACAGGSAGSLARFADGVNAVAVCDAARRSSQTRQWEPLEGGESVARC